MSQENIEKVRSCLDAWNRRDVDAWLEWAHPEIEWHSQVLREVEGGDTTVRGHEAMLRFWEDWHAVWEWTIDIVEIREGGDTVVALGRVRAHGEASGTDLERPTGHVFVFEEGLIRRVRAYFDPDEALEDAGLRD